MTFYMQRHVEREILSALIDGELSPEERRSVHEHLQGCDACRETLDEFGQVHGLVGELPRLVAPESFVTDVLEPARPPTYRRSAGRLLRLLRGRRRWVALGVVVVALGTTLAGLVAPPTDEVPPVGAFVERHVSVHTGVEPGAQVLFTVNEP